MLLLKKKSTHRPNVVIPENIEYLYLKIDVFPNPAIEYLIIKIEGDFSKNKFKNIQIYNMNSAVVYYAEKFEEIIHLSDFPQGVYYVPIDFGKQKIT